MRKITRIEQTAPELKPKKRVAAYARVSLESERLMHSLSVQVSYYNEKIQKNPEWSFAGVFADEGITGTRMDKRDELNRLIRECEAGNIDIILTKSISRFARNTVDLLETVRHLKDLGVEVRFEKENINSLSEDGELMMTLLASFAQEEIESLSNNVKWACQKSMQSGKPHSRMNVFGYRWEGKELVIHPEEAEVVRRIFSMYLGGMSPTKIAEVLRGEGVKSSRGNPFKFHNVFIILRNPIYKGDLLLQKTVTVDPIKKKKVINNGIADSYYVEGDHPAIIDKDTFERTQEELAARTKAWGNKRDFFYREKRIFDEKIICKKCGMPFRHKSKVGRTNGGYGGEGVWLCLTGGCRTGHLPELAAKQAVKRALGLESFDEAAFSETVEKLIVQERGEVDVELKNGTAFHDIWEKTDEGLPEFNRDEFSYANKLFCGICGKQMSFRKRKNGERVFLFWKCTCGKNSGIRDNMLRLRISETLGTGEFSDMEVEAQVDRIVFENPCQLAFFMKDGTEKKAEYYAVEYRRRWNGKTDNEDSGDNQ